MCRTQKILGDSDKQKRSIEQIKEIVEMGGVKKFASSGDGEVFSFRSFIDLLETDVLSKHNTELYLLTNLTFFNEKLWEKIKHNNIKRIAVSAEGCTKETYEEIRQGGKWEQFHENIKLLSRLRREGKIPRIEYRSVIMRSNLHEMGKLVEFTKDLEFDEIKFYLMKGRLPNKEENIWESCDLPALDEVHRQFTEVGAFDARHVSLFSAQPIKDKKYRQSDFFFEMVIKANKNHNDRTTAIELLLKTAEALRSNEIEWNGPPNQYVQDLVHCFADEGAISVADQATLLTNSRAKYIARRVINYTQRKASRFASKTARSVRKRLKRIAG